MTQIEQIMQTALGEEWLNVLRHEVTKPYFTQIAVGLSTARKTKIIYPDSQDVFKAYKLTKPMDVKVVVIGQDPYYNGKADGLAFSYKDGISQDNKQSLNVIFDEIEQDIKFGLYLDTNYNLTWLAEQGVLLLNSVLTVERNKPNSHKDKGWESFTGETIRLLYMSTLPRVFMVWGSYAKKVMNDVITSVAGPGCEHLILTADHPASDLYKRDSFGMVKPDYPNTFRGCKHFSKANEFLNNHYGKRGEIIW